MPESRTTPFDGDRAHVPQPASALARRLRALTRRELLGRCGMGVGSAALAAMLGGQSAAAASAPHFAPRARSVIYLHMVGAPSQLDLFDDKPALREHDGEPVPKHLIDGQRFAFLRGHPTLLGSRFRFARHGESGMELSELLPTLGAVADDIALVRSVHTEEFNHAPAQLFLHTGFGQYGRPSFGAWVVYGLGSENADLPSYVVLRTGATAGAGNSLWGSGFLPTVFQGVEFRGQGEPVLFLSDPKGVRRGDRRRLLDGLGELNRIHLDDVGDPEIATRIAQYETAFRMQLSVPELADISREPARVHELYGTTPGAGSIANNCLLARCLVERGVRFVQIFDSGWDHHGSIFDALPKKCASLDRPLAALIQDLKQRGLLDETLVVLGAEFGRTPMLQSDRSKPGRDHHKEAFTVLLAGGGVRGGYTHGETDELGYHIVRDPMHVNDFHATLLHLLGMDHERLTYRYQGRAFRLTDVAGKVAHALLA